jgi:hypothetical protein
VKDLKRLLITLGLEKRNQLKLRKLKKLNSFD